MNARPGRDFLLLIVAILPALLLGVTWMRNADLPAIVYLQNVVAAVVGAVVAAAGMRRRVSPRVGLGVTAILIVLLLATLLADGMEGVHRWIGLGPLTLHAASLAIPLVVVELDRMLREGRTAIALGAMLTVATILAVQPDAGQAAAFAGAGIVLLAMHEKRVRVAAAGMIALLALATAAFFQRDPLAPVAHVEEIAVRIAQQGAVWTVAVAVALILLIVPFVLRESRSAGLAVYLVLAIAASWWGNFPVPVLGFGMSPILGYFAGWTWLRVVR